MANLTGNSILHSDDEDIRDMTRELNGREFTIAVLKERFGFLHDSRFTGQYSRGTKWTKPLILKHILEKANDDAETFNKVKGRIDKILAGDASSSSDEADSDNDASEGDNDAGDDDDSDSSDDDEDGTKVGTDDKAGAHTVPDGGNDGDSQTQPLTLPPTQQLTETQLTETQMSTEENDSDEDSGGKDGGDEDGGDKGGDDAGAAKTAAATDKIAAPDFDKALNALKASASASASALQ